MNTPLEIIREWFNTLPTGIRDSLGFYATLRFMDYDPLGDRQKSFREWIGPQPDYFHHIGRTLSACALIDHVIEEHGDQQVWERSTDTLLDMMESDMPLDAKQAINEDLPDRPRRQTEWVNAASTWRGLRASNLSSKAVRGWEHQMAALPPSGPV